MKIIAVATLLLTVVVHALDLSIELGPPTFSGKGCADGVAVALAASGTHLTVTFPDSFNAHGGASGGAKHIRVACNGVLPLTIPEGFSVGITGDVIEGDVSIPHVVTATSHYAQVTSEVFFAVQQRGPKSKQRFATPGAMHFSIDADTSALTDEKTKATTWSSCGSAATLRINTALVAHGAGASIRGNTLQYTVTYKACPTSAQTDSNVPDDDSNDLLMRLSVHGHRKRSRQNE